MKTLRPIFITLFITLGWLLFDYVSISFDPTWIRSNYFAIFCAALGGALMAHNPPEQEG